MSSRRLPSDMTRSERLDEAVRRAIAENGYNTAEYLAALRYDFDGHNSYECLEWNFGNTFFVDIRRHFRQLSHGRAGG